LADKFTRSRAKASVSHHTDVSCSDRKAPRCASAGRRSTYVCQRVSENAIKCMRAGKKLARKITLPSFDDMRELNVEGQSTFKQKEIIARLSSDDIHWARPPCGRSSASPGAPPWASRAAAPGSGSAPWASCAAAPGSGSARQRSPTSWAWGLGGAMRQKPPECRC